MDVNNENIEPVTDLGLALSYLNQCIQRKLNSDSGAGANAGSRIHMTYVATEPLSELVWSKDSKHKGPSNVTLSPPQSNRSATDKPINEENLITPETSFYVKTEGACKDMTTSPTSDAGVITVCEPSHDHETSEGTGSNVEEVKAAVEVSVPYDQEATCSPVNFQGGGIPEIPETREKYFTTLPGYVDRERADILLTQPEQIIPFLEQKEPLLGDPVGGDRHADVGNQKMEMDPLLASEVHPVNEYASGAQVVNQRSQGRNPLDKMEATAENDLQNLKSEHAYDTAIQILGSESAPGVKDRFEQGEEMLPGNKSVLRKQSPTNNRVHIHRRKGKEKALSGGDLNGEMSKDDDDSHESVESCNSARLFSSGQKRWSFEEQFIVGTKRFGKKIQETPPCTSYIRPDSSFMNWISSMVKGLSKSMQDEAPSLALTLAHPHHGHESPDNKLITYSKNQDGELKNIGFQSMFQSLYCPKAEPQETRMLNDDHQMRDISTKLEPATTPKPYHGENINSGRGFILSVEKFSKTAFGNELCSARPNSSSRKSTDSQEKGNTSSVEKKNSCTLQFSKSKDRVDSNCSLGKRKKKSIINVESSPQSEGKTTDKSGRRSDLLENLWITRFAPKMYGPSLISDHHNDSAAGVLECSNNQENEGAKEQACEDQVIVIGNDLQNCVADSQGSLALNRNKGQTDQGSMSKLNSNLPSPMFRGSEAMASVFARRLDALKHISPSVVTDNAAHEIMTCFFCGIKGHHIRECSEIKDAELPELLNKFKSFNGAEYSPFCIRCFQCSHWAVACPNPPSMAQPQWGCNVSCLDFYCSPNEMKLDSRNMKIQTGKESQFPSSVAQTCFYEDNSRMETDLNMSWKENEMIASKKMRYRSNSVKKYSASNSGKENHILPSSEFVNTQMSDVPKRIFDSVKRLRLSRTDVLKWMKFHTSLSQLEGFFLRLRLGKWEEGHGGTGYHVSCITGSQKESCPENAKNSIAVVVGGIRCVVESQYVSNHDFLEDELSAWWSVISKGSGKIPSEEDLREKVKMKEMLGL